MEINKHAKTTNTLRTKHQKITVSIVSHGFKSIIFAISLVLAGVVEREVVVRLSSQHKCGLYFESHAWTSFNHLLSARYCFPLAQGNSHLKSQVFTQPGPGQPRPRHNVVFNSNNFPGHYSLGPSAG